jgi:hypothetical protein
MVTNAVGMRERFVGDGFGIARPVSRLRVSAAPLRFNSSLTNSQVVITVVEFKKAAAANVILGGIGILFPTYFMVSIGECLSRK